MEWFVDIFLFWEDVSFLLWQCGRCVLDVLALPCSTHLLILDMLRIFEKDIEYRYTDFCRDILLQVRHFAAFYRTCIPVKRPWQNVILPGMLHARDFRHGRRGFWAKVESGMGSCRVFYSLFFCEIFPSGYNLETDSTCSLMLPCEIWKLFCTFGPLSA